MSRAEDEVYGRLYATVENAILDLMLLLEDIAQEWAKARGAKAGGLKRPNWDELLEMRKRQEKERDARGEV